MRFSCEKNLLHDAISVCMHAVSSKASTPILEGLLVLAGDCVTICGFNYKIGIQKSFPAVIHENGGIVISARILGDIVRKMPGDTVEISADEKLNVTVKCGAAEFNLMGSAPQDFPSLPQVAARTGIKLHCDLLRDMISGTVFAVSTNENKPIHTGALFEVGEHSLGLIAVDGYRLAIRREQMENLSENAFKFVVPGETLRELQRILPDDAESICEIYPERKHALFEFGETVVTTRLLEGEFLNYASAVPADQPVSLLVDRHEIIAAVERVSLIISERLKNPVRCVFDGPTLKLSCVTALGRSFDECDIPFCEQKVEIGFNNRYLLDALRACPDDQVLLQLKGSLSPCTLRPVEGDAFTYLILPVRLKAGE